MKTIRLKLGLKNTKMFQWAKVIDCGNFDSYEMPTTLKDISIILWYLCGSGVIYLFAKELSKKLGLSYSFVLSSLKDVLSEYYEMSDEEAYEKTFSNNFLKEKT